MVPLLAAAMVAVAAAVAVCHSRASTRLHELFRRVGDDWRPAATAVTAAATSAANLPSPRVRTTFPRAPFPPADATEDGTDATAAAHAKGADADAAAIVDRRDGGCRCEDDKGGR